MLIFKIIVTPYFVIYYNVTVNIPMCYSNTIVVNMYSLWLFVRFAEKTSQNTVLANLLWEKNVVPAEKTSWKRQIIKKTNMAIGVCHIGGLKQGIFGGWCVCGWGSGCARLYFGCLDERLLISGYIEKEKKNTSFIWYCYVQI